jgi:hypothetical protein
VAVILPLLTVTFTSSERNIRVSGSQPLGDDRPRGRCARLIRHDMHHVIAVGQKLGRDGHLPIRSGPWRVGVDSGPVEDNCGAGDIVRADVAIHDLNSSRHRSPSSH